MDSLLGDFLNGEHGRSRSSDRRLGKAPRTDPPAKNSFPHSKGGHIREGTSFAQVTSSPPAFAEKPHPVSSSAFQKKGWQLVKKKGSIRALPNQPPNQGFKRRRSPTSPVSCSRCFRSDHRADECRHLIVCLRCSGTGHLASNCRSPKAIHSDPRRLKKAPPSTYEDPPKSHPRICKAKLSIPLSLDIIKAKQNMQNVVVATSKSGYISEDEIRTVLSNVFGLPVSRIITRFREHDFLINCASEHEAKSITAAKELSQTFFFGPGTLVFTLWSPEIGSSGRAIGNGDWINIWNLPLHCWGWSTVSEIVHLVGDLVTVRQSSTAPSAALSALVRLKPSVDLPLEVDFSVGMRRFTLLLTRRAAPSPHFDRSSDAYSLLGSSSDPLPSDRPAVRPTQHHSRYSKGKAVAPAMKTFASESENASSSSGRTSFFSEPPTLAADEDRNPLPAPAINKRPKSPEAVQSFPLSAAEETIPPVSTESLGLDAPVRLDKLKNPILLTADSACAASLAPSGSGKEIISERRDPIQVIPSSISNQIKMGYSKDSSPKESVGILTSTELKTMLIQAQVTESLSLNKGSILPSSVSSKQFNDVIEDIYRDASKQPPVHFVPPGFKWHFLLGTWTLIPKENSELFDSCLAVPDESEEDRTIDVIQDADLGTHLVDFENKIDSPVHSEPISEDSSYDFPEKVKLFFQSTSTRSSPIKEAPQASRRSSRPKKPPARWTDNSNVQAAPPQSGRKKGKIGHSPEGPPDKRRRLDSPSSAVRRSIQFPGPLVGDAQDPSTPDSEHIDG